MIGLCESKERARGHVDDDTVDRVEIELIYWFAHVKPDDSATNDSERKLNHLNIVRPKPKPASVGIQPRPRVQTRADIIKRTLVEYLILHEIVHGVDGTPLKGLNRKRPT